MKNAPQNLDEFERLIFFAILGHKDQSMTHGIVLQAIYGGGTMKSWFEGEILCDTVVGNRCGHPFFGLMHGHELEYSACSLELGYRACSQELWCEACMIKSYGAEYVCGCGRGTKYGVNLYTDRGTQTQSVLGVR